MRGDLSVCWSAAVSCSCSQSADLARAEAGLSRGHAKRRPCTGGQRAQELCLLLQGLGRQGHRAGADCHRPGRQPHGQHSVVGLTDNTGDLKTNYRYEPYGHPANFSPLGDENPFGYRGAYTAGVNSLGVICGGPNLGGGGYYDAEDGRNTQLTPAGYYAPPFRVPEPSASSSSPAIPSADDILDGINDVGGGIQDAFNEGKRFLRSSAGRCAAGGVLAGAVAVALTKNPACFTRAQQASTRFLAVSAGCGAAAAKKFP